MATPVRYPLGEPMSAFTTRKRFTLGDYFRMAAAGILDREDRVELIRGEILSMSPTGPPHNASVARATRAVVNAVGDAAIGCIQSTMRLNDHTAPEPDLAIFKPKEDFYASGLPGPEDTLLIVEVSGSSLDYDRKIKTGLYAEAGIPEYWIADIPNDRVIAFSEPQGGSYGTTREFRRGDRVAPAGLPACGIAVEDLLP